MTLKITEGRKKSDVIMGLTAYYLSAFQNVSRTLYRRTKETARKGEDIEEGRIYKVQQYTEVKGHVNLVSLLI